MGELHSERLFAWADLWLWGMHKGFVMRVELAGRLGAEQEPGQQMGVLKNTMTVVEIDMDSALGEEVGESSHSGRSLLGHSRAVPVEPEDLLVILKSEDPRLPMAQWQVPEQTPLP